KQRAFSQIWPERPLTMRIPASPQPGATAAPAAPRQETTAPAAPQPGPQPGTPPAPATAPPPLDRRPGQAQAPAPAAPQQTPQDQDRMARYLKFYQQFTDRGLEQEEAKLRKDDPGGMNVTTQYRMEAIDRVRALRQGPGGPIDERTGLPASPSPRGPASS